MANSNGLLVTVLDWMFFIYFFTHIPITIVFDLQLIFKDLHPEWLVEFTKKGAMDSGEPFLSPASPPVWFKAIIYNELIVQLPFFFLASLVFYKQSPRYNWVRTPCIMYATMALSFLLPICAEMFAKDYSQEDYGPKTSGQRLAVLGMYAPYIIFPALLLFRALNCEPMWPQKIKAT